MSGALEVWISVSFILSILYTIQRQQSPVSIHIEEKKKHTYKKLKSFNIIILELQFRWALENTVVQWVIEI